MKKKISYLSMSFFFIFSLFMFFDMEYVHANKTVKVTVDEGTISETMTWNKNLSYKFLTNSWIGKYSKTINYNQDGYEGVLTGKTIILTPVNKQTGRTVELKSSWTDSSYRVRKSDAPEPSSIQKSYTDNATGTTITKNLPKTGGLSSVGSKSIKYYSASYGRAQNYDAVDNTRLGYMSSNTSTYYGGSYSYSASKPRSPSDYYGPDGGDLGSTGWKLEDIAWDENSVQDAKASKWSYLTKQFGYMWRSDGGNLNRYRKGVYLNYSKSVTGYKYKQNYKGTYSLPDTATKWKVEVVYEGTVVKPPEHISATITDERYQNGNDYWVQPNDLLKVTLRQRDVDSGNKYQYIRLDGSGVDVRARHEFNGSVNNIHNVSTLDRINEDLGIISAERTENTIYGRVEWSVVPKTHGTLYNVLYHYRDNANNDYGYDTGAGQTNLRIRVDGVEPNHVSDEVDGARYVDGNDFWIRPNDNVTINLRQQDSDSGNKFQYLRLVGSGVDLRGRHTFSSSSTQFSNVVDIGSGVTINSATREENTNYGNILWNVTGQEHGSNYDIQYYYRDNVENNNGYNDTEKNLRVDGESPTHTEFDISGYKYKEGSNYWVNSNDLVTIKLRQQDADSGNKFQYIRFKEGDDLIARSRHDFDSGATTNIKQVSNSNLLNIQSANRTQITTYGEVKWTVKPNVHGNSYKIERYYQDNVENNTGYNSDGYLKVDDVAPIVEFRNNEDTNSFVSRDWDNETIKVRLKFNDVDSGYNKSRYAWTQSKDTPSENSSAWSTWKTSANYVTTKAEAGEWYLHVQAEDNVGNRKTISNGLYKYNTPPEVTMTYEPDPVYEGDTVDICVVPSDADDHLMNVVLKIRKNGGDYEIVIKKSEVKTGDKLCYDFVADYTSNYEFEVSVDDDIDTTTVDNGFMPIGLGITGEVLHTEEWGELHIRLGTEDPVNEFYSGETFVLKGDIIDHPKANESVTVNFKGIQDNGGTPVADISLLRNNTKLFSGEYTDLSYQQSGTALKDGSTATFLFEVKYSNGHIETDTVNINIIGDVYDVFQVHRKY